MPVNILDIPSEEKTEKKPPSLWIWGGVLICITLVYMYVFLVHFPQYLSKKNNIFWSELLLVPLLAWGGLFSFRVILWNNENIEVTHWNTTRSSYYQELLHKGRVNIEIIDLQVRLPDANGNIVDVINNTIIPMRHTPKFTRLARYLAFNSLVNEIKNNEQVIERKIFLLKEIMSSFIDAIYMHLSLLPQDSRVSIICAIENELRPLMENIWQLRFYNTTFSNNLEFSENLPESIDTLLDEFKNEYVMLISTSFHGDILLSEEIDDKSESVAFLFGKRKSESVVSHSSISNLYRPEFDWHGIDKSLIWGEITQDRKLSGILYSGFNEDEKNKIVLKTAEFMSESALSSFMYIDTTSNFCISNPLTEILQVKYIEEHLEPGSYLILNKNETSLISYFVKLNTGSKDEL